MHKMFSYGTLMDDEIRTRILGKNINVKPDILEGYTITVHPVLISYPVVKPNKDDFVNGVVFDVTENDIKDLDMYETKYYKREEVVLKSGVKSMVYIENSAQDI